MERETLQRLAAHQELSADEIEAFIDAIDRDALAETSIAAFLMGLLSKGVTSGETTAIVQAMSARAVQIAPRTREPLIDTCGTGGGLSTFNISTATALVCAAAGIPVAKHGSRSLSSLSGSADVLEALGVAIDLPPYAIERLIEDVGIGFIHAPNFHPVMRRLLPIEASLGIKTIFYSLIGPLINPARARRHLLGVYRPDWQAMTAEVVRSLGQQRTMVVHGLDGVDEISLLGPTSIHELGPTGLSVYEITPETFGLARCRLEDIRSLGPQGNAELLRQVFAGRQRGPARDAIVLNSAGALMLGERAANFAEGIALACELLDSGATADKLAELIEASQALSDRLPLVPPAPLDETRRLRTAEHIWNGLLDASPDGILLLGADGVVERANANACLQLGQDPDQLVGRAYGQLLEAGIAELRLKKIAEALLSGHARRWEDEVTGQYYGMTAIPIDDGSGLVLISRDISEQMRASASEQDKRARLKTLIETLPDLIWLIDTNARLLNCNYKFECLTGLTEPLLKGRSLRELLPEGVGEKLCRDAEQVLASNSPRVSRQWLTFAEDNHQEYVEIILAPFIDRGVTKGVMGIARDVTAFQRNEDELRQQKQALRKLLYSDELTGLPSRQAQIERIQALASQGRNFSIIALALNNFSRIFSNFGSTMSDSVIAGTASAIQQILPSGCELYRTADTRFAVVVVEIIAPEYLTRLANRIIECLSLPLQVGDADIFVNLSLGIASYPTHGANTDQLIRNTIAALNEAEQVDGTALRLFAPTMLEKVRQLQWLDLNLRLALERGQFELHYQPKVNLANGRCESVEALIRWPHPEKGQIRPDEFIGRSESNGLIIPLGHWIISTAARQAADWRAQGRPMRVAINISARQLGDPELLARLLMAQRLAGGLLDIELTESCLMSSHEGMLEVILPCREQGFGLHLDDFGTGYSSLSVLSRLPLTHLKIDRAFIQEIGKPGNGQALLKSMIGMARELGLSVVAEGVETPEQADFLRDQGVGLAQGWLYAPAMSPHKFSLWRNSLASESRE